MIAPIKNMSIRFTDDRILQILRIGIPRDILRNFKNNYIVMKDVSFGIANRILNVTNIDVNIAKEPEEVWVRVRCCDEKLLMKLYTDKIDSVEPIAITLASEDNKIEAVEPEEIPVEERVNEVKAEEIVEPEQPEEEVIEEAEVETPTDEEVSDSTDEQETPVDEESIEGTVEEESTSDEVIDETPVFVTGMSTDLDHANEGVTGTTTVASTDEETIVVPTVVTPDPSIKHVENTRRPVNINNNRKHKRH